MDGVFDRGKDDALHFFQATPSTEDVERLVEEIAGSCESWLAKQGYAGDDEDNTEDDEDAQGVLQMYPPAEPHLPGGLASREKG